MKNFGRKGLQIKHFFVHHGEKVGVACVAITIIVGLSKTEWAAYEKTPDQLKAEATEANNTINKSTWPKEKQAEVPVVDFIDQARMMIEPVDMDRYEYGTVMSEPLRKPEQLFTEPKWNPLESLIVDPVTMITTLRPEMDLSFLEEKLARSETKNATDSDGVSLDTLRRADTFGPNRSRKKRSRRDEEAAGSKPRGKRGRRARSRGKTDKGRGRHRGRQERSAEPEAGQPELPIRGERFVALRGVFNLKQQVRQVGKALRYPIPEEAAADVQFYDFQVQRQRAVAGPNPWKNENWENVDIERAIEHMAEMASFDADVVDPRITDSTITSPLPGRRLGYWTKEATHPLLEKYRLSEEESKQVDKLNQLIKKEYKRITQKDQAKHGGFSDIVYDMKQVRDRVLQDKEKELRARIKEEIPQGVDQRIREIFALNDKRSPLTPSTSGGRRRSRRGGAGGSTGMRFRMSGGRRSGRARPSPTSTRETPLTGMQAAVGRMLLFRFFDFTVKSGEAYRYRVKLIFHNPNYDMGLKRENVDDEAVIQGKTRESPWSEPSGVVVIPFDTQAFVINSVNSRPGYNGAMFEIFQWHRDFGTVIWDKMQCVFGQFLGGSKPTLVLHLGKQTFKNEMATFTSHLALVDASPMPKIELEDHPDLKAALSAIKRIHNVGETQFGIPSEALVVNEYGRIIRLDSLSTHAQKDKLAKKVSAVRNQFQDLKEDRSDRNTRRLTGKGRVGRESGRAGGNPSNTLRRKSRRRTGR